MNVTDTDSRLPRSQTASRSYYASVLGVPGDADPAVLKAAFRNLASRYHPDRNQAPGTTGRFREIAEAYAALTATNEQRPADAVDGCGYGARRAGARWLSPEDLWAGLDVESIFGDRSVCVSRTRREQRPVRHSELALQNTVERECADCGGSGQRTEHVQQGSVLFRNTFSCVSCNGRGRFIDSPLP